MLRKFPESSRVRAGDFSRARNASISSRTDGTAAKGELSRNAAPRDRRVLIVPAAASGAWVGAQVAPATPSTGKPTTRVAALWSRRQGHLVCSLRGRRGALRAVYSQLPTAAIRAASSRINRFALGLFKTIYEFEGENSERGARKKSAPAAELPLHHAPAAGVWPWRHTHKKLVVAANC